MRKTALLLIVCMVITGAAHSARAQNNLVELIDDFTTGEYTKELISGDESEFQSGPATAIAGGVLALLIRGTQFVEDPRLRREGAPRDIFEQVVARAPDFADGHAMLAMAFANEARIGTPAQRPGLFEGARREAEAAIRIDPYAAGAAYDALYYVARIGQPTRLIGPIDPIRNRTPLQRPGALDHGPSRPPRRHR